MRIRLRSLSAALLVALASAGPAVAQDAFVYYNHKPGAGNLNGRLSYTRSGRDSGRRQAGRPPSLSVPSESQLCIQVENRNAVLYSYTIAAADLPVDTIPGLGALIKLVTDPLQARALERTVATESARARLRTNPSDTLARAIVEAPDPDRYLRPVADLYAKLQEMLESQLASDADSSFAHAASGIAHLAGEAAHIDTLAREAFRSLGPDTASPEVRLIRATHADLWSRIGVISNRFRHALDTDRDPFCTEVGTSRMRVTLKIARTLADPSGGLLRPVGDTVLTVVVDPTDERTFLIEPGMILSAFTQDRSTIRLESTLVAQAPNHGVGMHAGVFAMARAGSIRWLWVTVGAATADNAVSDVFVGVTFRGGASLVGGRVSAGIGLALTRVPVGVSQGSVGSALPADIKNVDDVIQREFRPGLGVTFAIQVP
jgi:hypothetical protein